MEREQKGKEGESSKRAINIGTPSHSDQTRSWASIQYQKKRKEDEQDICGEKEKEKEREKHIITKKTQY